MLRSGAAKPRRARAGSAAQKKQLDAAEWLAGPSVSLALSSLSRLHLAFLR